MLNGILESGKILFHGSRVSGKLVSGLAGFFGNMPIFYVVSIEQIGLQIFADTLLSSTNISTKYGNFLEKKFFPAFFMW